MEVTPGHYISIPKHLINLINYKILQSFYLLAQ